MLAPTRSTPRCPQSRRVFSMSSNMVEMWLAYSRKRLPASVMLSRRPMRSNRATP